MTHQEIHDEIQAMENLEETAIQKIAAYFAAKLTAELSDTPTKEEIDAIMQKSIDDLNNLMPVS